MAGVGRFGALHARVWRELGAEVVGLCDVDARRLADVAGGLGVAVVSGDLPSLLARVEPDVVVVVSDEATHADLTVTALEAGCHVFVEKPLALSGAEAWRVSAAAATAGREVVAGQISRFAAPYVRMRQTLSGGGIGRLCALRLRRDFSRQWFLSFGDRVHPVWESCIHDIDLAVSFTGRPVQRVSAVAARAAEDEAPSVVSALLEFQGGVIATVESAWLVPDSAPRTLAGALALDGSIVAEAEVLGADGILRQRLVADDLVEWTSTGAVVPDLSLWPEEDGTVGGALRQEVAYAIDVFLGRRPADRVPLQEVCWGVEAAEAVVASLAAGAPVEVPDRGPDTGRGR
ncbi:Gfo/Idh/MocA family protein [Geodermatophilus maliterrae]|uniref:Gfo/Idh/MocA family protein n=1 Tax=Geodermatophilus maliterrae TaxID=3162531 RepID=A0ABV3XBH1_9ACTN